MYKRQLQGILKMATRPTTPGVYLQDQPCGGPSATGIYAWSRGPGGHFQNALKSGRTRFFNVARGLLHQRGDAALFVGGIRCV